MMLCFAARPEFLVSVQQAAFCVIMGSVCSQRPCPRSQFFRCQSPDFSPNLFLYKHSCVCTERPSTCLEFAFLHLAQFRCFGPSQSRRDSSPPRSSSLLCSALGLVASSVPQGELQWTSYASGDSSCRAGKKHFLQCLCFPPFSHFPKWCSLMLRERMLPALDIWLSAEEPKMLLCTCPRGRAIGPNSDLNVERHWARAETKLSFKPC